MPERAANWWRSAVVYQVYPRSFRDSNDDGMGDLLGIIDALDYLVDLGVDAIWLNPFYLSPMRDAGYDVADYEQVTPELGTTADAERLIVEAHSRGLKVLFDVVPNHVSWDHAWFRAALATEPGSPEWARFHLLPGRDGGSTPPTDWQSAFGGPAWTRLEDSQYWYLHLFDSSQPDVNWANPEVHAEYERVLRFWFDRGVDGFRVDVAHGLVKDPEYPDAGPELRDEYGAVVPRPQPHWDQPGVHDIFRSWRALADSYDPPRVFCAESWVETLEREADFVRPDELHTAFNFHYLRTPWDAAALREVITQGIAAMSSVGAPNTWVLSNHDVVRHASRLGSTRRARAATTFMLALPGSAYIYQGEELGLPEVFALPDELRQDPIFFRTKGEQIGRDGCRVPIPWTGHENGWLPQPADWVDLAVQTQQRDSESTLSLYRTLLHARRAYDLGAGAVEWLDTGKTEVLAMRRGTVIAAINFGTSDYTCPAGWGTDVIANSAAGSTLSGETAVWLALPSVD